MLPQFFRACLLIGFATVWTANARAQELRLQAQSRVDSLGDPLPPRSKMRYGTTRLRFNQLGRSLAFSPDSSQIYASDRTPYVRIWNVDDGSLANCIDLGQHVDAAICLPDSGHLLVNRFTGVTIRELPSGRVNYNVPSEQDNYRELILSPRGFFLASSQSKNAFCMWDTQTGDQLLELHPPSDKQRFECSTFSPNGRLVAIATTLGKVQLWDLHRGKFANELSSQFPRVRWERLQFLDDERLIASGYVGQRNKDGVYQAHSHIEQWRLDQPNDSKLLNAVGRELLGVPRVTFSTDRSMFVTAHPGEMLLWDVERGKVIKSIAVESEIGRNLAIAPNKLLVAAVGRESKMRLWNSETGGQLHPQTNSHHGSVLSIAESTTGNVLVSAGEEGTTRVWDRESGKHLRILHRNAGWTRNVKVFPDGKRILLCTEYFEPQPGESSFKGRVAIVNIADGSLAREWLVPDRATQVAISVSGKLIAFATGLGMGMPFGGGDQREPEVQVWDVADNKMIAKLSKAPHDVSDLRFTGDHELAIENQTGVYHWECSDPSSDLLYPKRATNTGSNRRCVLMSKDRKFVFESRSVYSRQDKQSVGTIARIQSSDQKEDWSKAYVGRTAQPMELAPSGEILAVALRPKNQLVMLNTVTGEELASIELDDVGVRCLQFSPDGKRLYAGMNQGDIVRWDMSEILPQYRGQQ